MIRELQNDILRAGLESRRVISLTTEPKPKAKEPRKIERKYNPEVQPEKRQKVVNKVYMMQK